MSFGAVAGGMTTIGVRVTGDNTQLRTTLRDSKRDLDDFGRQSASSFGALTSVLGRLAGPLGLAGLAVSIVKVGVGVADFTQKSQISFETMLGSAEKARTLLSDILAFAKQTPFAFPDLVSSAQRLLAFGISADNIVVTLRALGDAAAGAGKGIEAVQQIATVIGQIQSKGKLQGDELLQLSEAGIPALRILANQAGVTADVFSSRVTAGIVDADTAISGLIDGIEHGTTGVNGATVAFGGLLDKIKTSGGWTATLDSAKSGFRNMSEAITKSAVPAFTELLQTGTGVMHMVTTVAGGFNALPGPVRDATLAFVTLQVAQKLLGTGFSELGGSLRGTFTQYLEATRANFDLLGRQASTTRVLVTSLGPAARATGAALWSAFGGPVGLAIAGISIGLGALSSAQSNAAAATAEHEARVQSLAQALTLTNGLIDESVRKTAVQELSTTGILGRADALGLNLAQVTDAALGSADALAGVNAAIDKHLTASEQEAAFRQGQGSAAWQEIERYQALRKEVNGYATDTSDAVVEARRQKAAMDGVGDSYTVATKAVSGFTEEQQKAITSTRDTAAKAFDSALNIGSVKVQTTTADDLAAAQDKVTEATRRVRDAEQARADASTKDKVTAADRVRADESVQDARKALAKATSSLADTEAKHDPVAVYRQQVQDMLTTARDFAANVQTLAEQGLNATTLSSLIAAGPAASKDQIGALLKDQSLIGLTNSAETEMGKISQVVQGQAQVAQVAVQQSGGLLGDYLGLGMKLAAEDGATDTLKALADKLGEDPRRMFAVGQAAGLTYLAGFTDAIKPTTERFATGIGGAGGTTAYATGGIYPGYTPGRDVGYIAVSGGEAIMRPEWMRAVGPARIHQWNALARQGEGAIRQAMAQYMGGFANGGIAGAYQGAPSAQVITVPVSTTIERNAPWTIQQAYFTDPRAAERFGDRARARANRIGG